ncbi:MAG: phosphatidylserine/phosphatidylglycerophosphate/cardiolipin synthase family protein, partial [Deltaproteobacteria bacterium]|nr:phosphatidylserine/phosphatidylglycerophosphate/cardiolipin synthase family protein [Deltaproteobacteria bacterium]
MTAAHEAPPPDGVPEAIVDEPSKAIAVQLPKVMRPYARSVVRWRPGCDVTVLREGSETYPAMLDALRAAQRSICLETYILASDQTGERFKEVLLERAKAGVAVRVIYDAVGSFAVSGTFISDLRAGGIEVVDFNPIAPWRRKFRLSHRDHRKIIVVDDELAFTGGLNIGDDYASIDDGGAGWHDMHCKVTGAIVIDLARMFRRTWLRAGGKYYKPLPPAGGFSAKSTGSSFVRLLDNTRRRQRAIVRRAYLHVIRTARDAVLIKNAYFLPDRGLRRSLARAVRRGVAVKIVVPGRSDIRMIEWASLYVMRGLAKQGVQMLRWRGVMMHAKTAVVDTLWSTIGSYNFDAMSRFNNLEVTIE